MVAVAGASEQQRLWRKWGRAVGHTVNGLIVVEVGRRVAASVGLAPRMRAPILWIAYQATYHAVIFADLELVEESDTAGAAAIGSFAAQLDTIDRITAEKLNAKLDAIEKVGPDEFNAKLDANERNADDHDNRTHVDVNNRCSQYRRSEPSKDCDWVAAFIQRCDTRGDDGTFAYESCEACGGSVLPSARPSTLEPTSEAPSTVEPTSKAPWFKASQPASEPSKDCDWVAAFIQRCDTRGDDGTFAYESCEACGGSVLPSARPSTLEPTSEAPSTVEPTSKAPWFKASQPASEPSKDCDWVAAFIQRCDTRGDDGTFAYESCEACGGSVLPSARPSTPEPTSKAPSTVEPTSKAPWFKASQPASEPSKDCDWVAAFIQRCDTEGADGTLAYESCEVCGGSVVPSARPSTLEPTSEAPSTVEPTSARPSIAPTSAMPSNDPTTNRPSSPGPTLEGTALPSAFSSVEPSRSPTRIPTTKLPTTGAPTFGPSSQPTTGFPTFLPSTNAPSRRPIFSPSSYAPTHAPIEQPTLPPSSAPTTLVPSPAPSTSKPTSSVPSRKPTPRPSYAPTYRPTTTAPPSSAAPIVPSRAPAVLEPTAVPPARVPTAAPLPRGVDVSSPRPSRGVPTIKKEYFYDDEYDEYDEYDNDYFGRRTLTDLTKSERRRRCVRRSIRGAATFAGLLVIVVCVHLALAPFGKACIVVTEEDSSSSSIEETALERADAGLLWPRLAWPLIPVACAGVSLAATAGWHRDECWTLRAAGPWSSVALCVVFVVFYLLAVRIHIVARLGQAVYVGNENARSFPTPQTAVASLCRAFFCGDGLFESLDVGEWLEDGPGRFVASHGSAFESYSPEHARFGEATFVVGDVAAAVAAGLGALASRRVQLVSVLAAQAALLGFAVGQAPFLNVGINALVSLERAAQCVALAATALASFDVVASEEMAMKIAAVCELVSLVLAVLLPVAAGVARVAYHALARLCAKRDGRRLTSSRLLTTISFAAAVAAAYKSSDDHNKAPFCRTWLVLFGHELSHVLAWFACWRPETRRPPPPPQLLQDDPTSKAEEPVVVFEEEEEEEEDDDSEDKRRPGCFDVGLSFYESPEEGASGEDFASMQPEELQDFIQSHGGNYADCPAHADLVKRALEIAQAKYYVIHPM
ncbi:hypothetical protein CTAYLR_000680 [Chrysophaeum taylorii]|uniref:Uncharacterized protein n=1 Tax=Chrysophaeum taylorii TaxID=2483200 RepID=A0AAD7UB17_9STRA|nr:hypothetical protein CTAYLR_000680 [Chrysophaeum taylorii]